MPPPAPIPQTSFLDQHSRRRNFIRKQPFCPWHCASPRRQHLEFVQEQNGFLGIKDLIHMKSKVFTAGKNYCLVTHPHPLLSVIYFWCVRKPWGKIHTLFKKLRRVPVKFSLYSPNLKFRKTLWVLMEICINVLNNFFKVYSVIFTVSPSLKFTS